MHERNSDEKEGSSDEHGDLLCEIQNKHAQQPEKDDEWAVVAAVVGAEGLVGACWRQIDVAKSAAEQEDDGLQDEQPENSPLGQRACQHVGM